MRPSSVYSQPLGEVADAAADHGVVPPVVDAVEGVVVGLQALADAVVPLVGRQEVPLGVPALLHGPQRARRDGVLGLVLFERGRHVVADQGTRGHGQAGLGDDVARLGPAGRGRHGLSPLVDLLTLLSVTLARHRCPPVVRRVASLGSVLDPTGRRARPGSGAPTWAGGRPGGTCTGL